MVLLRWKATKRDSARRSSGERPFSARRSRSDSSMPGSNTATPTSRRRSSGTSPLAWIASTRVRSSSSFVFVAAGGRPGIAGGGAGVGGVELRRHGLAVPEAAGDRRRTAGAPSESRSHAGGSCDAGTRPGALQHRRDPRSGASGRARSGRPCPGVPHRRGRPREPAPTRSSASPGPRPWRPRSSDVRAWSSWSAPVSFHRACTSGTRPRASHESRDLLPSLPPRGAGGRPRRRPGRLPRPRGRPTGRGSGRRSFGSGRHVAPAGSRSPPCEEPVAWSLPERREARALRRKVRAVEYQDRLKREREEQEALELARRKTQSMALTVPQA